METRDSEMDAEAAETDTDAEAAAAVDESGRATTSRWPGVIIGIATVLAIVSVFTVWTRSQMLDTDEWVDLSTGLVAEPEVQAALADFLIDSLYERGNISAGVEERLPPELQGLAGFVSGALRDPLTAGVERLLGSERFQTLWETANRAAHETLVNILRDETRTGITTAEGAVALELRPMVVSIGERLGVSTERLDQIPEDAGQIVIFESDDLDAAQQAVRVLDFLSWFIAVVVLALYALAVYLARGRRRQVLGTIGWSLVGVGVVVLLAQAVARRVLLDALVENPANRSAADIATGVATGLLRQMGWAALIYGILIVAFAWLLGDHRWAVAIRRVMTPVFDLSAGAVAGGTAVLLLVLWAWSPGRVFESWATGLTFVGLVIAAIVVLRQRVRAESLERSSNRSSEGSSDDQLVATTG